MPSSAPGHEENVSQQGGCRESHNWYCWGKIWSKRCWFWWWWLNWTQWNCWVYHGNTNDWPLISTWTVSPRCSVYSNVNFVVTSEYTCIGCYKIFSKFMREDEDILFSKMWQNYSRKQSNVTTLIFNIFVMFYEIC